MSEQVLAELARLKQLYLEQLPATLEQIQQLGQQMAQAPATNLAAALHQRLHALAGSAGVHGLKALGEVARNLELQLAQWQKTTQEQAPSLLDQSWVEGLQLLTCLQSRQETVLEDGLLLRPVRQEQDDVCVWLVESDLKVADELEGQLIRFNFRLRRFVSLQAAFEASEESLPLALLVDFCCCSEGCAVDEQDWCIINQLVAKGCPLVVISEKEDFQSRIQASRARAVGYFLKPLDYPLLITRLSHLLDRQHAAPARVLIIDDDQLLAQHYRLVLMAAGMDVELLNAAQELMSALEVFRPELVLIDLHMPDYSGPELAGVIRQHEQWASLPLVYLSAETNFEQRVSALDRGGDDYLIKPISNRELVAAVRTRIDRARQLESLISKDSLTGLLKHASIKEIIEVEVARAHRDQQPACVVMLDIDHFKAVNDRYGHATGDVVILSVATLLRQRLRKSDFLGRYGGEEFAVILPNCDQQQAFRLMDEIRKHFSTLQFTHENSSFQCTISIGIAVTTDHPHAKGADLLVLADEALYQAKAMGRNLVRIHA
ncbi:diguanylate cyclase (GGDEF) domain-containing protein [Marinospirillum celere]|uniref:diguanylate cyclase n=1 Tax=Marinospirillum celere TaxID=1122252 RepID=A0A1I1J656_9GAMM|nr:diguanylate cyclase [Marinospirillum celere]SFC44004.1 diguanylate cyclase (GGDEF) domain-containing protein [Marinospirillum celere]